MKKLKLTELQKTVGGILLLGIVGSLIIFILGYFPVERGAFPKAPPIDNGMTQSHHIDELTEPVATLDYQCAEGKEFIARVEVRSDATPSNPGHAEVFLMDGSKLLLTQTASASGVRYANSGESFIFWLKGDSAFIEKGGQTVYAECVGVER